MLDVARGEDEVDTERRGVPRDCDVTLSGNPGTVANQRFS